MTKANEALQGKNPSEGSSILKNMGITAESINGIYNKYGSTAQAKMVLGLIGTTPTDLKNQALGILGGQGTQSHNTPIKNHGTSKYPRL